jgi:hypothetical protein
MKTYEPLNKNLVVNKSYVNGEWVDGLAMRSAPGRATTDQ